MSRRSLVVVIGVAAVLMFGTFADSNASPARVAGLNLQGPMTGFTRDYVNTYPFPVAINRYPNMMWAHLGQRSGGFFADRRIMGMFHELGEDGMHGVLGVTLRENSPMDPLLMQMGLAGASHQQFDLIYGRDMERMSFGLRFDMARSSFEDEEGNTRSPDEFAIGLGGWVNTWAVGGAVDIDLNENAMLEVGAEVRAYTFQDEETGFQDDGSISFRGSARVFHEWTEDKTLIPLVNINRTQIGEENGVEMTDTMTDFLGGIACNHMVNGGHDLLIYGAAVRVMSRKVENEVVIDDYTDLGLPTLFMAAEHRFKDWLVGRGGASQTMVRRSYGSDDEDNPDETEMDAEFNFALGLGLEWENFVIDATMNQNFPFTGPDFISGTPTNDLFGQVSFTYTYY